MGLSFKRELLAPGVLEVVLREFSNDLGRPRSFRTSHSQFFPRISLSQCQIPLRQYLDVENGFLLWPRCRKDVLSMVQRRPKAALCRCAILRPDFPAAPRRVKKFAPVHRGKPQITGAISSFVRFLVSLGWQRHSTGVRNMLLLDAISRVSVSLATRGDRLTEPLVLRTPILVWSCVRVHAAILQTKYRCYPRDYACAAIHSCRSCGVSSAREIIGGKISSSSRVRSQRSATRIDDHIPGW